MRPEPPPKPTSTTGEPSWIAPVTPVVPDHELVRRIGGGSYGEVWLARTTVGTWRAVKVVFRDRFTDSRPYEREFNGIQKFEPLSRGNEAFIDILQIGRNDAEGYFYYIMELADDAGEMQSEECRMLNEASPKARGSDSANNLLPSYIPKTLAKVLLQRGRLPLSECLELGLALNLGLAQLHRAGLIHRDIKPSNIIFVGGVPKLADIGLVIELAEARSFVGTEGFIPPEGPNSPQADLYSLGKVLYEAGMGKDRKDFPEPYTQIAEAPDAAALLEFNAILLKACAANRDERYQSAEEMNADLALLQSGGSVRRQRKLAGQLRFVQRAGALVTALAAVIALGWWWQARQTRVVRDLAYQKSQLAEEKTRLAEENRRRIVRLDVANGVRLLDDGDPGGSLLWFADSLAHVTNNPAEESIQRIRLQQTMHYAPHLVDVWPHPSSVSSASFSPDEKKIATACEDGFVRVWSAGENAKPIATFRPGGSPIWVRYAPDGSSLFVCTTPTAEASNATALLISRDLNTGRDLFPAITNFYGWDLSPDGRWLAIARDDQVQILSSDTGAAAARLADQEIPLSDLGFSPDSRQLITIGRDQTVRRWELPSGRLVGQPLRHDSAVSHAIVSPDGHRLVTATFAGGPGQRTELRIWNARTDEAVGQRTQGKDGFLVLGFDRMSRRLFSGDRRYGVEVHDAATGEMLASLKLPGYARCFDRSPADDLVAVGADDGSVTVWHAESGRNVGPPLFHAARVGLVQFDRTGQRLLTTSGDGTVKLWDLRPHEPERMVKLDGPWPHVTPGSIRPAFGREAGPLQIPLSDGTVRLLDPDTFRELHRLDPETNAAPSYNCEPAPNGRHWLLSGNGVMFLFSERTNGTIRRVELSPSGDALDGAFTRDSARLVTVGKDRMIRVWQTSEGKLEHSVPIPEPFTGPVCFSGDAKSVLLSGADGLAHWFDLRSAKIVGSPFRIPDGWNACLDPTGERLALTARDQAVRIMHLGTGQAITPLFKHAGSWMNLDWSADGRRLLTAGGAADARIWDAATGEQLVSPLTLGNEPMRAARWSADGRFVVARSDDQLVRVWDAATGEPVTPKLRQESYVRFAGLQPNGRLLIATDPNTVQAWNFTETRLAQDVLSDYARLISGRRLSPGGTLLPLKPDELAALRRSLATRAPELFQ